MADSGSSRNRELVIRLYDEFWNQNIKGDAVHEFFSNDHVLYMDSEQVKGAQGFKHLANQLRRGFSNLHYTVDDLMVDETRAVIKWTARGIHTGNFMGILPSNQRISYWGISWHEIQNGKITKTWGSTDLLEVMESLKGRPTFSVAFEKTVV